MSGRTCEGCRWFLKYTGQSIGQCRRYPPTQNTDAGWLEVDQFDWCGEWADGTLTAEQDERQELTMRFALAIVQGLFAHPEGDMVDVMTEAQRLANELLAQKEGQQ